MTTAQGGGLTKREVPALRCSNERKGPPRKAVASPKEGPRADV